MEIKIKEMSLVNFKGIRKLTIPFNTETDMFGAMETNIHGANGTGKSTIFDAFTWVLFGKDSLDRKDFEIKTLNYEGKVIPRIDHEVTLILSVSDNELFNGNHEITFRKTLKEKWTKRRGATEEEYTGNTNDYFVDDVPYSETDYKKKVAEICDESIFKLITNPLYFTSQKKEIQRAVLFKMAGDISDEEIAQTKPEFVELFKSLSGKTLEEYKREISAKKKLLKDEKDTLPAKIEERGRDIPQEQNWKEIEDAIATKKEEIKSIDEQLQDKTKQLEAFYKERDAKIKALYSQSAEISHSIFELNGQIERRKEEITVEASAGQEEQKAAKNKLITEMAYVNNSLHGQQEMLGNLQRELTALQENRSKLLDEYHIIQARELTFDDNEFVCPTCHRQFEADDIDAKKAEMQANFNTKKANDIEANKAKGISIKKQIDENQAEIDKLQKQIKDGEDRRQAIKDNPAYAKTVVTPDVKPLIGKDEKIAAIQHQIEESKEKVKSLDAEIEKVHQDNNGLPNKVDLDLKKSELNIDIENLKEKLYVRELIQQDKKRLTELQEQLRTVSDQLAQYEKIEFTIAKFTHAKIDMIETKINGMFEFVKFKLYDRQINGGEVETCEALVNGIPFSDANAAGKVNAGIDIINAICKFNNVYAPIFFDNRESVSELNPKPKSQLINLYVDPQYKELMVVNPEYNKEVINN